MRGLKLVPLCFGSLSAIAFALAVPSAAAQELHGHIVCRSVGAFTPEQLGDREGHALSTTQSSCQGTEGPTAGAVQTETNMWEWDGPKAKELSGYGVARKPGATFAFQHPDGTLEVTMTDGKPSGWTASGMAL
jgi:PAB1-binding protein PBP1